MSASPQLGIHAPSADRALSTLADLAAESTVPDGNLRDQSNDRVTGQFPRQIREMPYTASTTPATVFTTPATCCVRSKKVMGSRNGTII